MTFPQLMPNLPAKPAQPLKGRGHVRLPFPAKFTSKEAKAFWDRIPEAHRAEVSAKTKGRGNVKWGRFISPEVNEYLFEAQRKF